MNNNKYQVRVYKNTKIPYAQDWTGKKVSNFKIDIEPNVAYNTALVCGKLTNTTIVDLDIYKWSTNHIFYKILVSHPYYARRLGESHQSYRNAPSDSYREHHPLM